MPELVKVVDVLFLGASKVGITSLINRQVSGEFNHQLINNPASVNFHTSKGIVKFNLWERNCPVKTDAIILVFSYDNHHSLHTTLNDYTTLKLGTPIVICANKYDLKNNEVCSRCISDLKPKDVQFYSQSAKNNYALDDPFLYLIKIFMKDTDLVGYKEYVDGMEIV